MKKVLFIAASLMLLTSTTYAGRCSGGRNCTACKNCSACKNCAHNGGKCSVCHDYSAEDGKKPTKKAKKSLSVNTEQKSPK